MRTMKLRLSVMLAVALAADVAVVSGRDVIEGVEPGQLLRTILNPQPQAITETEEFGFSLATNDGLVLIGAPRDSIDIRHGGSAFLADIRTGTVLHEFSNPTPETFGNFGGAVNWIGDKIAIAAPRADDSGVSDSGSVYIFDANDLSPVSSIHNPAPLAFDNFGFSITPIDNSRMVITAPQRRDNLPMGGVAYIYDIDNGSILQTINNPSPNVWDDFGYASAAFSGGVVLSAPGDDTAALHGGVAYLFDPDTGALLHTFHNPRPSTTDYFGVSVAASEKYIVIGSQDEAGSTVEGAGTVYVYDAMTLSLLYVIDNPQPDQSDQFSNDIALEGDLLVIGAHRDELDGRDGGAVYQYDLATGTFEASIANPLPTVPARLNNTLFGSSVALSGEFILAGSPHAEIDGNVSGAVFVFQGIPEPATFTLLTIGTIALKRRRR